MGQKDWVAQKSLLRVKGTTKKNKSGMFGLKVFFFFQFFLVVLVGGFVGCSFWGCGSFGSSKIFRVLNCLGGLQVKGGVLETMRVSTHAILWFLEVISKLWWLEKSGLQETWATSSPACVVVRLDHRNTLGIDGDSRCVARESLCILQHTWCCG